jgi:dolichol-phosphate mannosyltransferase
MDREPQLLSVVAPDVRGGDTVAPFPSGAPRWDVTYELILVDDGSKDGTARWMARRGRDPRVKVVSLSRNFGHQPALTAGLEHARGDVIVMLDGDLQDPPEVIPRWSSAGARASTSSTPSASSGWGRRVQARDRARLLHDFRRLTRLDLAVESGDFRLMDRARSTRCWRCPSATASCAG